MTAEDLKHWINTHFDGNLSEFGRKVGVKRATVQQWIRRDRVPAWVPIMIDLIEYKENNQERQHDRAVSVINELKELRK